MERNRVLFPLYQIYLLISEYVTELMVTVESKLLLIFL